ncbi:MAG: glycosyltransferase [Pirellulaceae bacterium]|nr:glycosyltransferase [Pirellulaceae bacterium]
MSSAQSPIEITVVVPVFRGETTLKKLTEELSPWTNVRHTADGLSMKICEVLLVHDCGPDQSHRTIQALEQEYPWIRGIWLSRNFGQHAATLAGMATSIGEWVVTMDEDLQQAPADIAKLLDKAIAGPYQLVYAKPINVAPHGFLRNSMSQLAKRIGSFLSKESQTFRFNSFRLIEGEVARNLAAYCGRGIYLDIALSWVTSRVGSSPVRLRQEVGRPSGYSFVKLLAHFWRMLLSSGSRPLRWISLLGFASLLIALMAAVFAIYAKLTGIAEVPGWASLVVLVAFFSGCNLTALGVIAEYLALTMNISMGKPLYVVLSKPAANGHQESCNPSPG